jgi:hypothetical protein
MVLLLVVGVLGFSLEGRRLEDNGEPCKASCDAGFDQDCDEQDTRGAWTRSCDLHPTTNCDDDCHYPPPPPVVPWLGAEGTHPSPPPPPPPPEEAPLWLGVLLFAIALVFLCCVLCCVTYRVGSGRARDWVAYWCCCCIEGARSGRWREEERQQRAQQQVELELAADDAAAAAAATRAKPGLELPTLVF